MLRWRPWRRSGGAPAERCPLSAADLERWRIDCRRRFREAQIGGHVRRRRGQSLEFHDFRPYVPGDDTRHIDWRASARLGNDGVDRLVVRSFVAEDRVELVLSVDARSSMELPDALPKLRVARWLAEALTTVALQSEDRVLLHPLYGSLRATPITAVRQIRRLPAPVTEPAPLNLRALASRPGTIWVIITDLYDSPAALATLARRIRCAMEAFWWVLLVDLDSWPFERAALGPGAWRLDGPLSPEPRQPVELATHLLDRVEARIDARKAEFHRLAGIAPTDRLSWRWPGTPTIDGPTFFRERFFADAGFRRLFRRDA